MPNVSMRVLIVGAKGMLGQELARAFAGHDLHLWDREELDIADKDDVLKKIKQLNPDLLINAAAYNLVDKCEDEFDVARRINGEGPVNLSMAAAKIGATFVHYSTDYVFAGDQEAGYREYDLPAPVSKYGESKYLGEEVLEHNDATYLIRTSRLFGRQAGSDGAKKSFVEVMLRLASEKPELELVDEEMSCPTYAVDLAERTREIIEGNYLPGIYHVTNEGGCTWLQFAEEIFKQAGRSPKLLSVSGAKFPRPARRPMYSILLNTKLPRMRSWQAALKDFLQEIGEYQEPVSIVVEPSEPAEQDIPIEQEVGEYREPVAVEPSASIEPIVGAPRKIPIQMETPRAAVPGSTSVGVTKSFNQASNMKGIILSGGKGTRLHPCTKVTSKQLLPVYNKPMVVYPLQTLLQAGIREILIIVAPDHAGEYMHLLGSGKEWGAKFTYEIQDEPKGLPEAFIIGENFIGDDNVTMILGDNLFFDHDFTDDIRTFVSGGRIFAVEVADAHRFGVVEFDANRRVLSIEEKPKEPKSNFAIPGIYIYDHRVSHIAKGIKPTWRPETDITEIHKAYLGMNELDVRLVKGRWFDAGTHDSLLQAANIAATLEYQNKMGYNEKQKG